MPKVSEFHHGQKVWNGYRDKPVFGEVIVHADGDRQVIFKGNGQHGSTGRFEKSSNWNWLDVEAYPPNRTIENIIEIFYVVVLFIMTYPFLLWERFWSRGD